MALDLTLVCILVCYGLVLDHTQINVQYAIGTATFNSSFQSQRNSNKKFSVIWFMGIGVVALVLKAFMVEKRFCRLLLVVAGLKNWILWLQQTWYLRRCQKVNYSVTWCMIPVKVIFTITICAFFHWKYQVWVSSHSMVFNFLWIKVFV